MSRTLPSKEMRKDLLKKRNTMIRHSGPQGKLGPLIWVDPLWLEDKESFIMWALISGYSPGSNLKRVNKDGGFEPENCIWVVGSPSIKLATVLDIVE